MKSWIPSLAAAATIATLAFGGAPAHAQHDAHVHDAAAATPAPTFSSHLMSSGRAGRRRAKGERR